MCNGSSKIHLNGLFIEDFALDRGVRQGCPLAPLLFALSTQPLMEILKLGQVEGNIRGILINEKGDE